MIKIRKSPTADTRSCDWSKVDSETLAGSTRSHIADVNKALNWFSDKLLEAGGHHDNTKIHHHDWFHMDFSAGFVDSGWWEMHKRSERHHLSRPEGVPADVDLIDVLEYISDCVMAGMARSGSVYELTLPDSLLQQAFQNTVAKLTQQVVVEEGE